MLYDRHNVYKKISDYQLLLEVNNALFSDTLFRDKGCSLDLVVFNSDVLVAGHLSSEEHLLEERRRLEKIHHYRKLFNQVGVGVKESGQNMHDGWITAKIRSQIFSDDSIDPAAVKIMTADGIVYVLGDVRACQGKKVIDIAKNTRDVVRVVNLMNYLVYEKK